jgi:putative transposase
MIERQGPLSLSRQCELLGLSRAALYYRAVKTGAYELELMALIDRQYLQTPFYGSRRMAAWLQAQGHAVNRKRVQRWMLRMGLAAIYQRPRTSRPAPEHRIYPYLLRGLRIERVGQVWAADITYIPMARGFLYLVAVMDWVSRYVLAWRLSNLLDASFCIEALEDALSQGRPEIFNTDQGSQFTDDDFTGVLRAHGVAISMDGRGRFADNIFVERLWRSLKYEEVYLKAYESVAEARHGIAAYFEFYNYQRLHQALGYRARAKCSCKPLTSAVPRGGKTLARAQHYQHNEMQTRAGFLTLRSPDRCLEDRVHLIFSAEPATHH